MVERAIRGSAGSFHSLHFILLAIIELSFICLDEKIVRI